jgi:hypothetical protein
VVPTSLVSVTTFLLLLLPGIILELLRQRSHPGRADSVFVETARVLLGGAAITGVTLVLLGGIRTVAPAVLADPRGLLVKPHYVADHLWLTGWTVALFLLISLTVSALCCAIAPAPGLTGRIHMESAWVTTFSRLPQRLHGQTIHTQLQVELDDGSAYLGIRDAYSAEAAMADRELVLATPLHVRPADGQFVRLEEGWQRIIIPASQIRTIMVRFIGGTPSPTPATPPRGRRILRFFAELTTDSGRLSIALALEIAVPVIIGLAIG